MRHFYVTACGVVNDVKQQFFLTAFMDLHLEEYPTMNYLIEKFRNSFLKDSEYIVISGITEMSEEDFDRFITDVPRGYHLPDGMIQPN